MTDITSFLNARLDADERPVVTERMRREITAKRAILAAHLPGEFNRYGRTETRCRTCVTGHDAYMDDDEPDLWPCATVGVVAAIWSDHPDYDQAWTL